MKSDCCNIVNKMREAMPEEKAGALMYLDMSDNLFEEPSKDPIMKLFHEILNDMSKDEERHRRYLEAISQVLSDLCKCD